MAAEFSISRRVQFAETDMAGVVHFSNYFRWMEEVEHAFFRAVGLSVVIGVVLFLLLWWFSSKPRPRGATSGLFLAGYGVFRFAVEYTREPDSYLGLLALGFSMGQWLSLPMMTWPGNV